MNINKTTPMGSLVVISIGPVQSFIEAARKLEDLWSGSYVLSYLSEMAMINLLQLAQDKGISAEMIYPAVNLAQLTNPIVGPHLEVASVPNRFVCLVEADTKATVELAQSVTQAVQDAFADFCTHGVEQVFGHDLAMAVPLKTMAAEQAANFLEIVWAVEPMMVREDYQHHRLALEKRLAAVKNNRKFAQLDQLGPVCTVCGDKEALHHLPFDYQLTMGEMSTSLRKTWKQRHQRFRPAPGDESGAARINEGEFLCGICLGKRVAREFFQKRKVAPGLFRKYDSLETIAGEADYYAVLMMDGDDMGQWFNRERSIPYHQQLSRRLSLFSQETVPQLVWKHQGRLVYSGGDDVLAFMPVHQAIELATALRRAFGSDDKGLTSDATCSTGMVIAHKKAPLGKVLSNLRRLEKQAKAYVHQDGKKKKDALALAVLTKGEQREAVLPWDGVPLLEQVKNSFVTDLSTTFLYAFGQAFLPLLGKNHHHKLTVLPGDPELNNQLLTLELERVINRSWKENQGSGAKGRQVAQELISLHSKMKSTLQFIHLLEMMRFFTKKEVKRDATAVN